MQNYIYNNLLDDPWMFHMFPLFCTRFTVFSKHPALYQSRQPVVFVILRPMLHQLEPGPCQGSPFHITHRIHGTGIFTYIRLIFIANVGKYTSPMDPKGSWKWCKWVHFCVKTMGQIVKLFRDLTRPPSLQKVAFWKGNPRLFQGNPCWWNTLPKTNIAPKNGGFQ